MDLGPKSEIPHSLWGVKERLEKSFLSEMPKAVFFFALSE